MNKIYKIIWSEVRKCYVVVAEIAKNHGKNNVRSIFSQLTAATDRALAMQAGRVGGFPNEEGRQRPVMAGRPRTAARWIVPLMTAGILLQAVPGFASTITDKNGTSVVNGTGVHNIYAQTLVKNNNVDLAVNRFQDYKITSGDIANMYFRMSKTGNDAANLLNLVKNRIDVQGTVNAIKGNRIGGNLYFISPNGMAVGSTGVINAGKLVALAPTSSYFSGDVGSEGIWNSDANLAYQFRNDIANFGQRDNKGNFKEMKDLALNTDSKASITVAGRINARGGIVLGAGKIELKNGAMLQSQKDLDFTSLVNAKGSNGAQLTAATFDVGSVTLNPAADESGDIILRATAASEFTNNPIIPGGQTYNAIVNTTNSATVDVAGRIESDGGVDVSADAKTVFDNTTWDGKNVSEIGQNFAAQLGFNWEADWADKTNTASVTVGSTGSIKAGGDASLQADATADVKVKAAAIGKKQPDSSTAIPVTSVAVARVKNKALVEVAGDLASEGDLSLAASATAKASVTSKANTSTIDTDVHQDKGNAIYVGISWLTGDSIAQVSVKDKQNAQIRAEGDFSAEASSTSSVNASASVAGVDETFASTGIAVIDYDSAANVEIGRSIEAKSVKAGAENEVSGLSIEASNSNGEGDENYAGNAERIKWQLRGTPNASKIASLIKNKFNLSGMTNGGKLQGLEEAFTKAQEYVTAGAGIGVVDTSNTALVSVAPGVILKATGPATEVKDGKTVPGGDVTLSANTHMDSLHHAVSGEANKMDGETGSKVTVAAGVLYSSIENDAAIELQGDTKNHRGVTLESVNGSVNLKAETQQVYDPLEPFKAVPERLEKLLKTLKALGKEFPELADLHAETVTTKKQAEDGTISEETARKRFANYSVSFTNFLSKEGKNLIGLDRGVQGLISDVSDIFSPASYTNYYVRSYTVDSHDGGGSNVDVGISLNIAKLHNKGIVSLGEKANITAGRDINIDASADTNVFSATGNGGEYFAFSESNGNGVGASVAVQDFSGDSLILSGKNAVLKAKCGKAALNAANEMKQTGIILSAGKADSKLSASGSVNVLTGDSNSLILVDDETTAEAAGDLALTANNNSTVTNIVGGLALGSAKTNVSIGAGVAVNSLGVNSMAVIGDNGSDASAEPVKTDTDDFKKKTAEEQNKIKGQNTLANARKLAQERAAVKKLGTDFNLSDKKLNASMGAKTSGTAKGSVSAKNVYATGNSGGTLNAVALEGASNSENHSGFDTVNKWAKEISSTKDQGVSAMKNIVGAPLSALDMLFDKSNINVSKTWDFSGKQIIQAPNANPSSASFNAAAAGSVSWNKVNSETASVIDNVSLNLDKTTSGKLLNAASDDVFSGAWSGAAAVNWFTGGAGSAANPGSHKGGLGTALAVNNLKRDVDAVISNSSITKAGTVENTAIKNGAEAAAALGIAVTNDSQGTGTNASVAFGLSLNKSDSGIHALMIDNTATNTNANGTTVNNRAYDGDIQVAGGIDFAFANAGGGRAIGAGITAAVSEIKNDIQSGIQGGTYTGIKDIKVAGEEAITQVNAAVAIGVTTSEKGFTGTGSLAYANLDNVNRGYISGTNEITATGEVSVTDRDISGSKDNIYKEYLKQRKEDPTGESYLSSDTKSKLGVNAGSSIVNVAVGVSAAKNHTVGAAVTVGKVANKFSSDITGNKKLTADAVKAAADVHTNIVSVGAGVSVSTKNFGGAGSLSFNDLDQDNIVSVTGNRNGSADGITANTVSGTAKNTSHIVNVTGDFAGGKNAVGLGIAYNRMDDTTGVYAANNRIQAKTAANGVDVSLDANNDAYALALSVGAAATYKDNGTVAAHGNAAVNRGHNDTMAVMGEDKDGNGDTTAAKRNTISNASSVKATATDKTSKTTIGGAAEVALKDTTVALGIGIALTESDKGTNAGDGRETVRAEINNADITTVKKNNAAPVISAVTTDEAKATTVAVGIGITKKSLIGAQGIGADANIFKNNTAGLKDTSIDKNSGSKAALVTAKAGTSSGLYTGAAALQLSGSESFLTGVVSVGVNRIKDTTAAGVTYTNKQTATSMNVGNLDIGATSNGDITSVAMGVSGTLKGTAAVGGSGSHNYIENNAAAKIEKADIYSAGNVGVVAKSDEAISNYAGIIDVAAGGQGVAAAIGVTGSNNKISGNTSALIDNSKVAAKGSNSNKIKANGGLKTDDTYLIDGAVTRNTWKSSKLQKGRKEEEKTGVVVDASATHAIASVMANGGVAVGESAGVSVAGVINLNDVEGSTTAKVLDSQLNTKDVRSDVNVHAADYTNVAEFSGAASVGIGETAGVAAGFTGTTNDISRVTAAGVTTSSATWDRDAKQYVINDTSKTRNTVYAQDFNVSADAKQAMSAFNVTGAVAGSTTVTFETGDNVNTNKMHSSTVALVTNTTGDYTKNAKVEASHEDGIYNLNVDAGIAISADPFSVAGSLNVGVGVVNEDSTVTADVENSSLKSTAANSSLSVGASNKTNLEAKLVSVGVAAGLVSAGIASSIAVNNIDTRVTSRIAGSELAADTLTIGAANETKVKDATGTGAGALAAGIGVGVDVTTFNDTVSTIVDKSNLKAKKNLAVNTNTQREIGSTVAGVGIGAAGISVNVLSVTVNDGVKSLGKSKDGDGKDTAFSHTDTINKVLKSVNDHNNQDYSANFHGMTEAEKKEMKEKVKTNAKSGDSLSGTGVHTYIQNSSTLEATNGALTVNNTELNDADLNGGSGSLGLASVNVADTVYHLNQLNDIYVKDSTVKGGSVSLTTHQGNVTANNEDAIRLQTVQAGLGLAGIGVGYAGLTTLGNTGITIDHGTLAATNGDLTVKSSDAAQSRTKMVGVSAGALAVPVSVAHNTNIANNFVNVQNGSTLTASKGKSSASISLQTERTGRVAGKTVGVGVGGAAVVVNTAKVYDKSSSAVSVTGSNNTFTASAIRMEAVNAPVLRAEAGGTGVALLGVSVMQSNAEAYSSAKVDVADNNKLLGEAVAVQAVIGTEGQDMTHAETHGTSATLVGVNPNKAKAITETTASVSVGRETYKTAEKEIQKTDASGNTWTEKETVAATELALITKNNASRRAVLGNTTIGLLASIGTGDAKAVGDDKSLVTAKGGSGNDSVKLAGLKLSATGSNTAKGFADGDSGGITAWGAAATITMRTKTTNTASLSGAWDVTGNADIGAVQQVTARGSSKTGAGGAFSVTWANSDSHVEMDTKTELKDGAQLNAGQSYITAANKIATGAYDGESWNNHMNVGGVLQVAPDIKSEQVMTSKASVNVGKNAGVTTAKGQVFDAYTDMDIYNKVEGKGGGVAENIFVYSDNFITSTNAVTVDAGARLNQKGEYESGNDITLSSSDRIRMDVAAESYSGGLEGVLVGQVDNRITRNNTVDINGALTSTRDINLYSGVDADGSSSNLDIKALAEAHNNTLLSFYTDASIKQDLKNNQQVKVGSSGSAVSVRNINASAENGSERFRKHTVEVVNLFAKAKDTDKTVTNTPGTTEISETNNNFVNVEGLLKTGIQNSVKIDITGAIAPSGKEGTLTPVDGNGNRLAPFKIEVTNPSGHNKDTLVKEEDIATGNMDYATQLGVQLEALEKLIADYSTGDSSQLAAYLGYVQQRQRILDEMDSRGLFDKVDNGKGEMVKVYKTSGFTISYAEIPEITVSGGNITVQSDNLYGKGKLEANGKPQVTVNNLSNAYLKLNSIRVGEEGGDIRFQGSSIPSGQAGLDEINRLNRDSNKKAAFASLYSDSSSGAASQIAVLNNNESIGSRIAVKDGSGKTGSYTAIPDVAVIGDLYNPHGVIKIENKQGNITLGSGAPGKGVTINGKSVELVATKGSISQDYVDGIVNVGGQPQSLNSGVVNSVIGNNHAGLSTTSNDSKTQTGLKETKTDITRTDSGRIAGDSIYIAAADINVNGVLQSGYAKYVADIGADALSEANIQKMKNSGREVTVKGRAMYKVNDGNKVVYDTGSGTFKYIIQVYYDPQEKQLVVEDIDTKGGKIYLTGRISSTGNGKILAADGGAEIAITNATSADLATGTILNNDIEGKIVITDLARDLMTEYSRSATYTVENYSQHIHDAEANAKKSAAIGWYDKNNEKTYGVKSGLRYNWTLGQETGTSYEYHHVTNTLFWGGVDVSSTSDLKKYESSSECTPKQGTDRELGNGNFIDTVSNATINGTSFGAILENRVTDQTRTLTGSWKESGDWWALWSNPKYHTTWTTKIASTQAYTFSLQADHPIAVGFIGQKDGSIAVANTNVTAGNVSLNGNILSNTKDAVLSITSKGGSVIQKSGTDITTGRADLQAKNNIENIRITSLGERVDTGRKDANGNPVYTVTDGVVLSAASTRGGNVNVTVTGGLLEGQALPGNVTLQKLFSEGTSIDGKPGDVILTAKGNITQNGTGVTVKGQSIHMISTNGGVGTAGQSVMVDSSDESTSISELSAGVNVYAENDIYVEEAAGDMRVGSVVSRQGDVSLAARDGRLIDALPRTENSNNMDEEDLVHHWIDAGLIAGTEDYEGAYITGLKRDAQNYADRVKAQYAEFKSNVKEVSLRQKFTRTDGSGKLYTSADEYLAADAGYRALTDSASKEAYASRVRAEFAQFTLEAGILKKFTKADGTYYTSAGEYLDADAKYQQLVQDTLDKTTPYVRDVNEKFTAFKRGDETYRSMFTKADGSTYDTVAQYLLQDKTYQGYVKSQNDYSANIFEEFSHITSNKSKGQLADMFTLPSGKTYASAEEYLRDDATYQAMVKRYTNPEFAWTKEQLLYAIRSAIVNKESGVTPETQIKEANVQGRNVKLTAKGIGLHTNEKTVIKASEIGGGSEQAIANLQKLSNADATDVVMLDSKGNILRFMMSEGRQVVRAYDANDPTKEVETDGIIDTFVIGNMSPLGVYTTGKLDVAAGEDNVFVAGRSSGKAGFAPVNVGKISAAGREVRLYTQEGIYSAATTAVEENQGNIQAKDLIAYGGNKDIGTADKNLTVSLSGDLLSANADRNVYIKNIKAGDLLRVGSLYAGNILSLASAKGYAMTTNTDYSIAYLNAKNQLELNTDTATGVIGTAANPIRILNNGTFINLDAKDAYVKGVNGLLGKDATMKLGLVDLEGELQAASEGNLEAAAVQTEVKDKNGNVIKPSVNGRIDAAKNVKLEAVKDVIVSGPVQSAGGNISVAAGNDARVNYEVSAASGNISISAENEAKIKQTVTTGSNAGSITISGRKGVNLDAPVRAGNLNLLDGVYTGGGPIVLISREGSIIQGNSGSLKGASVTTTSGYAVDLTNAGNTFRSYRANGVERVKTDEKGNAVTDTNGKTVKETVIDGSVKVSAHGGKNLDAAVTHTVYGDVELANLDAGSLTVVSDITAKQGKDGQAGSITFKQQGDILAKGTLKADGTVTETATGSGSITNQKAVVAGTDVRVEAVSGAITMNGDMTAEKGNVAVETKTGAITVNSMVNAGQDMHVISQDGVITVKGHMTAEDYLYLTTTSSDISLTGDATAGTDLLITSESGNIGLAGNVRAEHNVNVVNGSGDTELRGMVNAHNDVLISAATGNVLSFETVAAGHDFTVTSESGIIGLGGDVDAANNIIATSDTGTIMLLGNIGAGQDITAKVGGEGTIMLNNPFGLFFDAKTGDVYAGRNITLESEESGLVVAGKVTAETGTVRAVTKKGVIGFMGDVHAGKDIEAVIREGDERSSVNYVGTTVAGNNVIAMTAQANITYEKDVNAGNIIQAVTDKGNIVYEANVTAGNSVLGYTASGNIAVGEDVVAQRGIVQLATSAGSVIVGQADGSGNVRAYNDIRISTEMGEAAVRTSVTSENGSVSVDSLKGNIYIGELDINNAISAKKDIALHVADGVITVRGKTETAEGNITVEALNKADAQNIVIEQNGKLVSGQDLTLHTYNGDITVTDNTLAKRNLNVLVDNKGSIEFGRDVTVGGDVKVITGIGNVTMGKRAGNGITEVHTVTSTGGSIDIETGKGNISIGHNAANDPTVVAKQDVKLSARNGIITVDGKTETEQGDITVEALDKETDQNIVIKQNGVLDSGRDLTLHTYNGGIEVTDSTLAKRDLTVIVENRGGIAFGRDVDVTGNITVQTGSGDISVGKKVKSQQGSIDVSTKNGNIRIGDSGADVETLAAYKDVRLDAENGRIEVHGMTSTETGDIRLRAWDTEDNRNIVIDQNGRLDSGRDLTLQVYNGDIEVTEVTTAKRNLKVDVANKGNVSFSVDVTVDGDIAMETKEGSITVGKDLTAGGNIDLEVTKGNVDIRNTVTSKEGSVTAKTAEGKIRIGNNGPDEETVTANKDITLESGNGTVEVYGKTSTAVGDIRVKAVNPEYIPGEGGKNIIIAQNGSLDSGKDAYLTTGNGDLVVTGDVTAKGTFYAQTEGKGNISLGENLTVENSLSMSTETGNITVGKTVTAKQGSVTMTSSVGGDVTVGADIEAGKDVSVALAEGKVSVGADVKAGNDVSMNVVTGDVKVGSNGKGSVIAENDVKVDVTKGDVNIEKSVEARKGSVDVKTGDGDIHIGDESGADTVKAGQDVKLETKNGRITIDGGIATKEGDIRVRAARSSYDPEGNGENIAFGVNGRLDSGKDAYLTAKNGDLVVANNVTAEGTFYARTEGTGNISLGENLTVKNSLSMSTETGNITIGKTVTAKQGSVSMTSTVEGDVTVGADIEAGKDVSVALADGTVSVGADVKAGENVTMEVGTGNIQVDDTITTGKNVETTVTDGNVLVGADVKAGENVTMEVGAGNIQVDDTITAGKNVETAVTDGNVLVGADVKAGNDVSMNVVTGDVKVGSNGKGSVIAENDVTVAVTKGDVAIEKSVEARKGSVDVKTADGNIHIGNEPGADTVKAGRDVKLETKKGRITIDGRTSTVEGNITVKAASATYDPTGKENNIVFGENGKLDSGNDAHLIAKNGDLTVTDDVTAKGTFYARTEGTGNISLGENLTVKNNLSMSTETGNITVGKTVTAKQGSVSMTSTVEGDVTVGADIEAGKDVSVALADGTVSVGADVKAGENVTMKVGAGNIQVDDTITAGKNVETAVTDGNVLVGADVKAGNDVSMNVVTGDVKVGSNGKGSVIAENDVKADVTDGNVLVGADVKAGNDVSMNVVTGDVKVGSNGKGSVIAENDVTVAVTKGDVAIEKSVEARKGSVDVKTADGDIHIGNEPGADTVKAGQDVKLETKNGRITIDGGVTTAEGDIRVKAARPSYDPEGKGENIGFGVNGRLNSGKDAYLTAKNGDLVVANNVTAEGTFYARTEGKGNISLGENLTVENDLSMSTETGNITVGKDITAKQGSVSMQAGTGNVQVGVNGEGSVTARKDIAVAIADGNLDIATSVVSNAGNVVAKLDKGSIHIGSNGPDVQTVYADGNIDMSVSNGDIIVHGKTETARGDITMEAYNKNSNQNLVIENDGKLVSGRDLTMKTYNGSILVTDDTVVRQNLTAEVRNKGDVRFLTDVTVTGDVSASVTDGVVQIGKTIDAGRNIDMTVGTGSVLVGDSVKAGQDISMNVNDGGITIGDDVTSEKGAVSMKVGTGNIAVGDHGSGRVTAEQDVSIAIDRGNLDIATSVESRQGSVDAKIGSGNIHIGDNGPGVETVTAMKNVTLETGEGKIEVFGKTSTRTGDVTLKAASREYVPGNGRNNIIIDHNGEIDSGNDASLITKNGDLHVTHRIAAKRTISAVTQEQGSIYIDREIDASSEDSSVIMRAEGKGDIMAGIDPATGRRYKISAGNSIDAYTGDGDISVGTAQAKFVSLVSRGENGHVTADAIHAKASGNANGTGAADIVLGGSYVKVGDVVNDGGGTAPLAISTMGSAPDRAMKDFTIGVRNEDGSYSGGILSASGAVIQQLWADTGMIYAAGDTGLHISKILANDKIHVANDRVDLAIYGRIPTHDGERIVFWDNVAQKNPADSLASWYGSDNHGNGRWMWMDLKGNGRLEFRNGVLVDYNEYRHLYGDYPSLVNMMRKQLDSRPEENGVSYFNRYGLVQYYAGPAVRDATEEEIVTE